MNEQRTYNDAYTGDDTIPAFVAFCIEQYKVYKDISGEESMRRLSDAGVLEYIADQYDVLHTENKQWILEDFDHLVETKLLVK